MIEFRTHSIKAGCDIDGNQIITIVAPSELNLENLIGIYDVTIKKHRNKRSLNANALLWKCIGSIADVLNVSKDDVYMQMLDRYGVQKFLVVRPDAVDGIKRLFRAAYEMGSVYVNGKKGIQLRCIVGSSQYDTAQMSRLLNGTISECKELGAFVPDESDVGASLDLWEKERE